MEAYKNPALPIRERVDDLMTRMTLEEKVRQLGCTMALTPMIPMDSLDLRDGIGEVALSPVPVTVKEQTEYINNLQHYVIEHSRLGIPALFSIEGLAGPVMAQGHQFPISIGLGASFSPETVRDMCRRSRRQLRTAGIYHIFSPVMDVCRDLRWGRVSETYGGDPTLVSAMSCAFVDELQKKEEGVGLIATAKHFLGYSSTERGLNMARTIVDKRELREVFAKPFEAAIREAGLRSVMNSYSEINGEPVCASKEILEDLLRKELGFDGFVISDAMSISRLVRVFKTAETIKDAGIQCLEAGLDMELPNRDGYGDCLIEAVRNGEIDEYYIDRSARRILTAKFESGLFEHPFPQLNQIAAAFDNTLNDQAALDAARKIMTLTANDGILPIRDPQKRIAVIGPHGDSLRLMYSCYSWVPFIEMMSTYQNAMAGIDTAQAGPIDDISAAPVRYLDMAPFDQMIRGQHPRAKTIVEALKETFETVTYTQGCSYNGQAPSDIDAAVQAAKEADIVILTVGGKNGWGLFCTGGEGIDSSSLELPGEQETLMHAVYEANHNLVIVHTDAHPLMSPWTYEHARAILETGLPCHSGGQAIVETLIGKNVPGGKLPMDVPKSIGQMPLYHYLHNGTDLKTFAAGAVVPEGYVDTDGSALRPFGYGLSYTDFAYSDLRVSAEPDGNVSASVTVTNTGHVDGDEVVQLYMSDLVASVIRPAQELIGFRRVHIPAGGSVAVRFTFNMDQLSFENKQHQWVVEKGDFRLFVGGHSSDHRLESTICISKTRMIDPAKRSFYAQTEVF